MAEKRRFYNTGHAKGFSREKLFQTMEAILEGEEVEESLVDLTLEGVKYELERIGVRRDKAKEKGAGEKRDPLQSDYAVALREAFIPLLKGSTDPEGLSATELCDMAAAEKTVSPTGNAFTVPWVSRVLRAVDGVKEGKKIVTTITKDGLKQEKAVTTFKM